MYNSIKHHLHVCRDGAMGSSRQDGRKMMAGQKPVSKWISWMFHEWRYNCDLNLISHNLSHHALILPATFLTKIINVISTAKEETREEGKGLFARSQFYQMAFFWLIMCNSITRLAGGSAMIHRNGCHKLSADLKWSVRLQQRSAALLYYHSWAQLLQLQPPSWRQQKPVGFNNKQLELRLVMAGN